MANPLEYIVPGLGFLGGLLGGGNDDPEQQLPANLHLVNPGQQKLWDLMQKMALSGAGDFGFGSAAKQAKGNVQQFLADRGVDLGSGFAAGAMGDAYAGAAAQDKRNRNDFMMSVLNSPLQVAAITGKNLVPGNASGGAGGPLPYKIYGNSGMGRLMNELNRYKYENGLIQ